MNGAHDCLSHDRESGKQETKEKSRCNANHWSKLTDVTQENTMSAHERDTDNWHQHQQLASIQTWENMFIQ